MVFSFCDFLFGLYWFLLVIGKILVSVGIFFLVEVSFLLRFGLFVLFCLSLVTTGNKRRGSQMIWVGKPKGIGEPESLIDLVPEVLTANYADYAESPEPRLTSGGHNHE